jgi:hypothetical protein
LVATRRVEIKKRRNLRGSGQRTVSTTKFHTLPLNVIRFPVGLIFRRDRSSKPVLC